MNRKILSNKFIFLSCIGLICLGLVIYSAVSLLSNKSNLSNVELNVSVPQVYINDFSSMQAGDNAPDAMSDSKSDPQIDILVANYTKEDVTVHVQHIITVYAKAINDIEEANIDGNDYLDASMFFISNTNDDKSIKGEVEDKYYILEDKTAILARRYEDTDGDIIAVRYYVNGADLTCPTENECEYTIGSYKLGLSAHAPLYFYNGNSETCVSIKTQVTADDISLNNWKTIDSQTLYSINYNGNPIDTTNLSPSTVIVKNDTEDNYITINDNIVEDTEPITTTITTEVPIEEEPIITVETTEQIEPAETEAETEATTESTPETTTAVVTEPVETTAEETTTTVITTEPKVYPDSMSVNTGSATLNVGETAIFSISFTPSNTTETSVTWASSNPSIATVNNGQITAISSGSTSITATSINGMVLTMTVTVNPIPSETTVPVIEPTPIEETVIVPVNIVLNYETISLNQGDSYQLSATVYPLDLTNAHLSWVSSNPSVASISESGMIFAISSGTAEISVTSDNGIVATCKITVV